MHHGGSLYPLKPPEKMTRENHQQPPLGCTLLLNGLRKPQRVRAFRLAWIGNTSSDANNLGQCATVNVYGIRYWTLSVSQIWQGCRSACPIYTQEWNMPVGCTLVISPLVFVPCSGSMLPSLLAPSVCWPHEIHQKVWLSPGSNWEPSVCETEIITIRPLNLYYDLQYLTIAFGSPSPSHKANMKRNATSCFISFLSPDQKSSTVLRAWEPRLWTLQEVSFWASQCSLPWPPPLVSPARPLQRAQRVSSFLFPCPCPWAWVLSFLPPLPQQTRTTSSLPSLQQVLSSNNIVRHRKTTYAYTPLHPSSSDS